MSNRADCTSAPENMEMKGSTVFVLQTAYVKSTTEWVGLERSNHTRWLDQCRLLGNAPEKMRQLKAWHKARLGIRQRVAMHLLCRQYLVAVGTLGPTSTAPEAQAFHETQFETLARNDVLSRGFVRPHSLIDDVDIFERLPSFKVRSRFDRPNAQDRHVLFVGHELNKTRVFYTFLTAATLTLGISIGLGAVERNVGLGATIGAAVFGFIAVAQVAIIWLYK